MRRALAKPSIFECAVSCVPGKMCETGDSVPKTRVKIVFEVNPLPRASVHALLSQLGIPEKEALAGGVWSWNQMDGRPPGVRLCSVVFSWNHRELVMQWQVLHPGQNMSLPLSVRLSWMGGDDPMPLVMTSSYGHLTSKQALDRMTETIALLGKARYEPPAQP